MAAGFASPSGNIRCYLDVYSDLPFGDMPMVCLIFDADWDLPPDYGDSDPTCDLDRTRTLILQPTGRPQERWTCHGDVFWPEPLGTLSYGSEWSMLGYGCRVETRGVTCTNGDKTFFVSRATRSFF
ncbi:hypothetical protein L0664_01115 [Octadecabacter sp. G9-8]|uniref:Uncharacterized protein n=1 Tax=Octadecabacter dasysiphoniae TaxID=2909341 RepID=A0ABS9CR03_9RHOB|nr:hypothetical protein [Octadecabacter dasysiphoniae]MCF2869652.1 hypothetical protein [Octadecabacter dasysiphoniae]